MFQTDTGNQVPALEKGLDILEALALEQEALSQKQLAQRVGRSASEVFRVLQALETRGYIARDIASGRYSLTLKLFELSNVHPPTRRLVQVAVPFMERLANDIRSSCHMVVQHGEQMIVLAQAQPDGLLMGWSVRIGGVFPLSEIYASARTIASHQRPHRRLELAQTMTSNEDSVDRLLKRFETIESAGVEISESTIAPGVRDISTPILNHIGNAAAALTVSHIGEVTDVELLRIAATVRDIGRQITLAIGGRISEP